MKDIFLENTIHPTAIIGSNVKLGRNNIIGPYTIIEGNTEIGDNNHIGPHVTIGCLATDNKRIEQVGEKKLIIGNNNDIREYSLIEMPCYENETIIGNNVFLMQGVHVSHDVHLRDNAVITNSSILAGIVKVLDGANVAMACVINQYTIVGQYSIVAANSACMKNVRPFSRYIPGKPTSVNTYAIKKFGFEEYIDEISRYVFEGRDVSSPVLCKIVNEFDKWVVQYGHPTY